MTATLERVQTEPERVRLNGREFASRGGEVIDWIESNCVFTKARWRGEPFALLPWEQRVIWELFEVEQQPDGSWRRRYRWAYIEIGKKNGKTELIAAIDLYLLIADDEESPEIACGSNSEEQADLVFGACKAMCELSPTLRPLVTPYRSEIVLNRNPAAKIIRVSAKAKTNDGRNLSGVTLDELHEFDEAGDQLFKVLTNGMAAREQPLVLMITTAGHDPETLCGRYHEHAEKVISGEIIDPQFFARIYAASSPDVNLEDVPALERALKEANPSFGHTVKLPFYLDERRKGAANFKRYYLNIWTPTASQWLPDGAWEECRVAPFDFQPDAPTYVGLDGSTRIDSTAVMAVQWRGDQLLVKCRTWERPRNPATGKLDEAWRLPFTEVKDHLRTLHRLYDVRGIAYDPAIVTNMAQELEVEGLRMVEHPQTNGRMCPPTQTLYALIIDRRLGHDGDPTLARHVRNAVAVQVAGGGQRLGKTKQRKLNDAAIALVMAMAEAGKPAEPQQQAPRVWVIEDE